jgi:hypothetical protein
MPAINEQIVVAYEELGMTSSQIAADQELDEAVVKAVLLQSSEKYRKETQQKVEDGYTDTDLSKAFDIVRNTAFYSEDEHLRYKAAESIIDEKKGRKDIVKQINNYPTINALIFNVQLQKAQNAIKRATTKVIDVCPISSKQESSKEKGVPA